MNEHVNNIYSVKNKFIYDMDWPDLIRHTKAHQAKFVTLLSPPEVLAGRPFSLLESLARYAVPAGVGPSDRCVYLIVTPDFAMGRLGQGLPNRFWHNVNAYYWNLATDEWREKQWRKYLSGRKDSVDRYQPMTEGAIEVINKSGDHVYYTLLAHGLTKTQSQAGEKAIFDELRTRRHGGWLVNPFYG
jgi:hypothetical protein